MDANGNPDQTDLIAQAAALARRQKLLDTMQQQSQQPIVANNWGARIVQALAKVGMGGLASKAEDDVTQGQAAYQSSYSKALQSALQDYMAKAQGTPAVPVVQDTGQNDAASYGRDQVNLGGTPIPQGQATGPSTAVPAVPGDMRAAVASAMASRFPEMQTVGKEGLAALQKADVPETYTGKPVVEMINGQPTNVLYGSRGTRKVVEGSMPMEKGVALGAGQSLVNPYGAGGAPGANPVMIQGTQPGKVVTGEVMAQMNGTQATPDSAKDLYQQHADGTWHKVDNSTKVSVSTNVKGPSINLDTGQKAGFKETFDQNAKTVAELAKVARTAGDQNQVLAQMEALDKAGTFTGPASAGAIKLGQLAKSMGIPVSTNDLANSEAYQMLSTKVWQQMIAAAGGNRGITSQEAEQLKVLSPSLANSPQARAMATQIMRNANGRSVAQYRQAQQEYNKQLLNGNPQLFDMSEVSLPTVPDQPIVPGAGTAQPTKIKW